MPNVCDVLIKLLSDAGVRHIFGVPGDSINSLTDAIRRQDKIRFIHVNHEETGAFAAATQAKLTGELSVCVGTSGPGAIHLLNGLYDAKCDHAPVLAITGQIETRRLGSDYQQEINVCRLFDDVSVYNQMIVNPEQMPYVAARAIHTALEQRGVVHLNIPLDVSMKSVPKPKSWHVPMYLQKSASPIPDHNLIALAANLINKKEKIVILAGIGCYGAEDKVYHLAEILNAPIIHALRAKELFPESHAYSIGGIGNLGVKPSVKALSACDLLLMIGTDFPYDDFLPKHGATIQIDLKAGQIGKRHTIDIGLAGDAGAILDVLMPLLKRKQQHSFLQQAQNHKREWQKEAQKQMDSEKELIKPQYLAHLIGETAPKDAIFICDTGEVTAWCARHMIMQPGQRFTVSGLLASMAFGLPGAIGAQLAYPDRPVIALVGDGGFSMLMTDFATAVRYKLPIKIIVFNNRKLGMITIEQEARGQPDYQTDNYNPDFAEFAKLCGGNGLSVTDPARLPKALEQMNVSNEPFLLDVQIDAKETVVPPKVTLEQMMQYGMAKIKEFIQ